MFRKFVLALALLASAPAFAAPAKKVAAPVQSNALSQVTLAPTYLDGTSNSKFAAGSNSFSRLLKKDGSEEVRAALRLNAGVQKEANVTSAAPQKLHLSVFHIENKKTVETMKLAYKGAKASEVGTRVLTFEGPSANGRMVAKVQQEQASDSLWKTTGTTVQFVPAGSKL